MKKTGGRKSRDTLPLRRFTEPVKQNHILKKKNGVIKVNDIKKKKPFLQKIRTKEVHEKM